MFAAKQAAELRKAKIDELSEEVDCSFLQGDGSQSNILREVNPAQTNFLFCLTKGYKNEGKRSRIIP